MSASVKEEVLRRLRDLPKRGETIMVIYSGGTAELLEVKRITVHPGDPGGMVFYVDFCDGTVRHYNNTSCHELHYYNGIWNDYTVPGIIRNYQSNIEVYWNLDETDDSCFKPTKKCTGNNV